MCVLPCLCVVDIREDYAGDSFNEAGALRLISKLKFFCLLSAYFLLFTYSLAWKNVTLLKTVHFHFNIMCINQLQQSDTLSINFFFFFFRPLSRVPSWLVASPP